MTTQSASLRLADQLSANPYAWPGGYPLFGVFHDGGACCAKCASSERESIGTTNGSDGWRLVALEVNWENPALRCDACGVQIDAAYGDCNE